MRQLLRNIFLCGCFTAIAVAQEVVTIKAPPNDLSRPVSSVIDQIRKQTRASITYEDPRYINQSDIEDVTDSVSKAPDAEKKFGSRILIPKGHPITFVYAPSDMKTPSSARAVLERLGREYARAGGPAFTVTQDNDRLHVVPDQVLDASGALVHQNSIFETVITVSPSQRNGGQLLQAICDAVRNKTGIEIQIGPSVPSNYLARFEIKDGITSQPAAKAIANLLDAASPKAVFDWDLYFDPADKSYMLNFAYVDPAAIYLHRCSFVQNGERIKLRDDVSNSLNPTTCRHCGKRRCTASPPTNRKVSCHIERES